MTSDRRPTLPGGSGLDGVDAPFAGALRKAADAGRFDLVAQLVRELEARRTARAANVVPFARRKPDRTR